MDPIVLAALLKEAEAAYHSLMTGTSARVVVDQNGDKVEFTPANSTKLAGYITQLQLALGISPAGGARPAGPAMFFF